MAQGRRWTPKNKFWVYQFLVARDGERCLLCRKGPAAKRRLEIDHVDGNSQNDDPANLCLLCSECNKSFETVTPKVKRRILQKRCGYFVCVREREKGAVSTLTVKSRVDYQKGSPEMQANDFFETDFREWVLDQVRQHGNYPKNEAINSGAEVVGCSVVTSRRLLQKLTSSVGIIEEYKNLLRQTMLRFKPDKKFPVNGPVDIDELLKSALAYLVKKPERVE